MFPGHFAAIRLLPHQAGHLVGDGAVAIVLINRRVDGVIGVFTEDRRITCHLPGVGQSRHRVGVKLAGDGHRGTADHRGTGCGDSAAGGRGGCGEQSAGIDGAAGDGARPCEARLGRQGDSELVAGDSAELLRRGGIETSRSRSHRDGGECLGNRDVNRTSGC